MADNPSIPGRRLDPVIPLTDPRFKYINAAATDIRATFERVRAELAAQQEQAAPRVLRMRGAKR